MRIALLIRVDCRRGTSCKLLVSHQTKLQPGFAANAVKSETDTDATHTHTHTNTQIHKRRNADTQTHTGRRSVRGLPAMLSSQRQYRHTGDKHSGWQCRQYGIHIGSQSRHIQQNEKTCVLCIVYMSGSNVLVTINWNCFVVVEINECVGRDWSM